MVRNAHYCQGALKDVSAYLPAEACHTPTSDNMPEGCPMHADGGEHERESRDCCQDESQLLKLEHEQSFTGQDMQVALQSVAALTALWLDYAAPRLDRRSLHYLNYKPPLLFCSRPAPLLQTFLC